MNDTGPPSLSSDLALEANGTAHDLLVPRTVLPSTAANSVVDSGVLIGNLKTAAAHLRDRVQLLSGDIGDKHLELQGFDLHQRGQIKARKSVQSLLRELSADRGMSWSNIARALGVSVGALRKWRRDGAPTGENRLALGLLAAFLDLLEAFAVEDPVGWLDVPLLAGCTLTALDLYCDRRYLALLEYAGHRITAVQLLDSYDSAWRDKYRSIFDVYEAADGELAIRESAGQS